MDQYKTIKRILVLYATLEEAEKTYVRNKLYDLEHQPNPNAAPAEA